MSAITPKSTDQDSELWASYTAAIAALAGVSVEKGGAQRLHIAPLSYHCFVSAIQADEGYANYMVYNFGNSIPRDDHPILDIDGNFTDAYWTYITQIDQSKLFDSGTVTAAAKATAELKTTGTTLMNDIAAARVSFPIDCPPDNTGKNIDSITGAQIQFAQYLSEYHPEIAADQLAQKDATSRLNEILNSASSNPRVSQYQEWLADFQKGIDNNVFHNGFNKAVEVAEPLAVSQVAQSPPKTTDDTTPFYDPLFTIGGNLQKDIDSWTSTFPQNYATDRSTYLEGASLYSISKENLTSNTWEQFGFSSSTSTSGSSGWIFWGDMSTTTTTTNTHNLNVTSSDITSSIDVRVWGIGSYPVIYGAWYHDLLTNFPELNSTAWTQNPNIALDIAEKYSTVLVGYGIELTFTLSSQAIQKLVQAKSDAESSNSGVSIFGCIYNSDNSSSSSNSSSLTDLKIDTQTGTVTILAKDNKIPVVLGAIADKVENVPTPSNLKGISKRQLN